MAVQNPSDGVEPDRMIDENTPLLSSPPHCAPSSSDLVPLRDVAAWQAAINLAATTGRSLGGPVGGWLADTIGWRWSFLGQAPIFFAAAVLCVTWLPRDTKAASNEDDDSNSLGNIDFVGALLLALLVLTILMPIEIGGAQIHWTHPLIFILFGIAALLAWFFVVVEKRWAKQPIFPLALLSHRDLVLANIIAFGQVAAQLGLMFAVPLYFQVTERASNTVAGAHLFPAVVGNAVGGIVGGVWIKKTGRYKKLMIFATITSFFSYLLIFFRWHGHTNIWESLYIIPAGFGSGLVQSAVFISVQASLSPSHKVAATYWIFLTIQVGMIMGLACVSAVVTETMKWRLSTLLGNLGIDAVARHEIIEKASSNVDYIDTVEIAISKAIVESYAEIRPEGEQYNIGIIIIGKVV
ncbi:hypothetical protein G7Z17_g11613 [Cylindrodendrum hubeiense]|uniref:Major facilitator superfamily (MFS) profile domain-containing protein n=1 Tax=Cylindrodendrum hubeiense TaxID=595255 RepID=A0A9P5GZW3_9HYPO|nr:hypothetical protein G7Z17_g11613 [Cylindrodendrum hubeiense]